jgi:hypothetical protein
MNRSGKIPCQTLLRGKKLPVGKRTQICLCFQQISPTHPKPTQDPDRRFFSLHPGLNWNVPLRAFAAVLALALCAAAASPSEPAAIRKTAVAVSKDLGVQTKLPTDSGADAEPSPKPRSRGWSLWGDSIDLPAAGAVFDLVRWAVLAALVVAVLAFLTIWLREPVEARRRPALAPGGPLPDTPLPPADPHQLLARADQLAAAGRYAEAMHCVLLAATAMLGRGQSRKSSDSLTSWELLRAATLSPPQLQALRDVVVRVERAWFGKRPAELDDYQQVRGSFQIFASTPEAA